ncbi:MAG: pyridoxamine 5'-phosphate oxidase family protein [Methylococcaceae bacterium]|nr:pyridoxamine 5'-phosphate oxidase family protein [Methylococcaceae bacterium]
MPNAFATISFTESVKAAQTRYGSRENNLSFELSDEPRNELGEFETEFIAARDSFYQATISENGWPYVQHRGGPKGFLKVLDSRTIGFADFKGNRQYISVGNLSANPRISIILMDYPNRRRLKIWGTTRVIDENEEPELIARLEVPSYRARVERGILIQIEAIDWNCPQHITPRFTEAEMDEVVLPLMKENQQLRAQSSQVTPTKISTLGEGELDLVITGMRQLTPRVRAYELRRPFGNNLPKITAGSHLRVPVLLADGTASTRHYSICSNPNQNSHYEIAVLLETEGNGGSRFIHENYQPGMNLHCSLPSNNFILHTDERPAVLIAGGIGITPIMAMAKTLKQAERLFQFHYIGRSLKEMAYIEELQFEFDELLNIYTSQQGINLSKMMANVTDDAVFYVCGPERLINGVLETATQLGISESRIRFERFSTPTSSNPQRIIVELRRSGKTIHVSSDQSILSAVEDAGIKVLSDCKVGNCGTCAVKVIAGIPQHLDSAFSERERTQGKKMCICVSRANSEKLVLDL